jgi:hypothetical protein
MVCFLPQAYTETPGAENWNNMRRDYNMDLKPWRASGNHILICLQRPLGWSMRGADLMKWLKRTLGKIRENSDRPILIRWHPGDWKAFPNYKSTLVKFGVTVSPQNRHITEDLVTGVLKMLDQDVVGVTCATGSKSRNSFNCVR